MDAVREGVRVVFAKCEATFRLQEPKKRMRDCPSSEILRQEAA